jgi:hypothetical protein
MLVTKQGYCGVDGRSPVSLVADEPFEVAQTEALRLTVGADSAAVNTWRGRPHAATAITVAGQPPLPARELAMIDRRMVPSSSEASGAEFLPASPQDVRETSGGPEDSEEWTPDHLPLT